MSIVSLALALSVPSATDATFQDQRCTLSPNWKVADTTHTSGMDANSVRIDGKQIIWNDGLVDEMLLRFYVSAASRRRPRPVLLLYGRDATCDDLRAFAAVVEAESECSPALCVVTLAEPPRPVTMPMTVIRPPVPRNPQGWLSDKDYPAAALRAHSTGATRFQVNVDRVGRVQSCTVTGTSGDVLLDTTTCDIVRQRGRFTPATDIRTETGVPGSWSSVFRWLIADGWSPRASWATATRFEQGASGPAPKCKTHRVGARFDSGEPCGLDDTGIGGLQQLAAHAVVIVRRSHVFEGVPLDLPEPKGASIIFRRTIRYAVTADGRAEQCQVLANEGEDLLRIAPHDCHPGLGYARAAEGLAAPRFVTLTQSIATIPKR